MAHGPNHFGNSEVMLNHISTETYLQETFALSLPQTMSCEPDDAFLPGNVSGGKLHECG